MNVDCCRYCLQKGECVVKVKYCYLYCHNSRSLFHLMFAHLQQAQTADAFWQVRILRTCQNYDLFILNTEFFVPGLFRYMTDCSAWCVETKMLPSGTLVLVFNLNVIWNQVGSFVVSVWTPFGFGIRHRIETYSKYFSRLHVPFHNPYSRPRVTLWLPNNIHHLAKSHSNCDFFSHLVTYATVSCFFIPSIVVVFIRNARRRTNNHDCDCENSDKYYGSKNGFLISFYLQPYLSANGTNKE